MDTRRGRRIRRQRVLRSGVLAASFVVIGVALGVALPQDMDASFVLLAVASGCVVLVATRRESVAAHHGLYRPVRLPVRTAISATFGSFRSRITGTARATFGRPPEVPAQEPDDEAEAWWGPLASPSAAPGGTGAGDPWSAGASS